MNRIQIGQNAFIAVNVSVIYTSEQYIMPQYLFVLYYYMCGYYKVQTMLIITVV